MIQLQFTLWWRTWRWTRWLTWRWTRWPTWIRNWWSTQGGRYGGTQGGRHGGRQDTMFTSISATMSTSTSFDTLRHQTMVCVRWGKKREGGMDGQGDSRSRKTMTGHLDFGKSDGWTNPKKHVGWGTWLKTPWKNYSWGIWDTHYIS